ncbi:hypothetical protein CHUAL_013268 [Chamberlinius hualienensis]
MSLIETMKSSSPGRVCSSFSIWDDMFQEVCKDITVTNETFPINVKEMKESCEISGDMIEPVISTKHSCSICKLEFPDYHKQKIHFKSDLHCINLKRKVDGKGPLNENESEYEESEESSSSDTEPELELIDLPKREPVIIFENLAGLRFSTYKCLILTKRELLPETERIISRIKDLPSYTQWAVIILSAGHFAAAILNRYNILEHKTFHRYVTRRKQGTSQSSYDQHSGHHAKSAGAALRRQQELALIEDISSLLQKWQPLMEKCSHIFYRACGGSRRILFSGKKPVLLKGDVRLRKIPFPTKRPSYEEVIRTHSKLSTIENIDQYDSKIHTPRNLRKPFSPSRRHKEKVALSSDCAEDRIESSRVRSKKSGKFKCQKNPSPDELYNSSSSDSGEYVLEMEEETVLTSELKILRVNSPEIPTYEISKNESSATATPFYIADDLYTACKVNDLTAIKTITASVPNISKVLNIPLGQNGTTTYLHIASQGGFSDLVWHLMDFGADPTVKNAKGQLPYHVAMNKDIRNIFTQFMAKYPDKFNYVEAQVPPPLTEEEIKLKALKKQKQRQEKKIRSKETKMMQEDKLRFMALTDYEKVWVARLMIVCHRRAFLLIERAKL